MAGATALIGCAPAAGHAATTAHHAVTESYGWPQRGVTQDGTDCLAAAAVTFLETYGLHVSQYVFASEDPGASTGHAAVLINGYLRPGHVHVITAGTMNPAQLRSLLMHQRPVLATLWDGYLPEWRRYRTGAGDAHEVMLWRLTSSGEVRFWDPAFGWETTTIYAIAAATWEYLVPVA